METSRELESARRAELARALIVLSAIMVVLYETLLGMAVPPESRSVVFAAGLLAIGTLGYAMSLACRGRGSSAGLLCASTMFAAVLIGERLTDLDATAFMLLPSVLVVAWTASARTVSAFALAQALVAAVVLGPMATDPGPRTILLVTIGTIGLVGAIAAYGVGSSERLLTELEQRRYRLEEAEMAATRARAADEAKSGFLAAMSHELRTPLNAVLGYAELLGEELEDRVPEALADLERITRSGQHLRRLIDDVLDLSKVEAGRMVVAREPFAIGDVVEDVLQTTRSLVFARNNQIEAQIADGLTAIGDRQRLRQILLNLVGNSAKFTSDGQIYVRAVEDEGRAAVVVGDTGQGMTVQELKRAFEKFGQAGDPTKPEGGTGLGLPIARELTAAMGGHLVATSEPGRGTEIMLRLPMQQPARASLLVGPDPRRGSGALQ